MRRDKRKAEGKDIEGSEEMERREKKGCKTKVR